MIDCGIDGSGNLAKEYFPDVIHRSNNQMTYDTGRDSYRDLNQSIIESNNQSNNDTKSWWETTNWFRGQSQAPTNQPISQTNSQTIDLTVDPSVKHILDAPGHAACFNRFATTKPKPINQTTTETFVPSNNQLLNPSNRLANQPAKQLVSPPINQSNETSISQTVNPALNRTINPVTIQSAKQSDKQIAKRVVIEATLCYPPDVARSISQSIIVPLYHPSVYQSINLPSSRCILLTGDSGNGKTTLYRSLVNQLNVYSQRLDMINYSSVTSSINQTINLVADPSKTCIDYAFETVRKNAPAILFLDDFDMIGSSNPSNNPSNNQPVNPLTIRMRNSLMKQIDDLVNQSINHPVIVIGACINGELIDRAFVKPGRFDQQVHLSKPDMNGRTHLINQSINRMICSSIDVPSLASRTVGWCCADIAALCREAGMEAVRNAINQSANRPDQSADMTCGEIDDAYTLPLSVESNKLSISQANFENALTKIRPSSMNEFSKNQSAKPSTTWSDIGGYESIKQRLIESVVLPVRYPHLFDRYNQPVNQGALLYGPPGTGKSSIAKAMADCLNDPSVFQALNQPNDELVQVTDISVKSDNPSNNQTISFISIKGPELLDSYLGTSEAKIRALFAKVRKQGPAILFLDEIDSIAPRRGQSSNQSNSTIDRVVNTLLMELDDRPMIKKSDMSGSSNNQSSGLNNNMLFVIAATNRPDLIDRALLRPGRLDQLIHVGLPSHVDRLSILQTSLKDTPTESLIDQSALNDLVARMNGFSGADVASVVHKAQKMAVRRHVDHLSNSRLGNQSIADEFVTLDQLERALLDTVPSASAESIARCVLFEQGLDQIDMIESSSMDETDDQSVDLSSESSDSDMIDDDHLDLSTESAKRPVKNDDDEKQPISVSKPTASSVDKEAPHLAQLRASIRQSINQSVKAGASPQQALNLILEQFVTSKQSDKRSNDDEDKQPMRRSRPTSGLTLG